MAANNNGSSSSSAHVLIYPYPASGHIIPLLDLTHQLLTRGLTVTVIVDPSNESLLHPIKSRHVFNFNTLILPSPAPDFTFSQNNLIAKMKAIRDLHFPLIVDWFNCHVSVSVSAIISDFFLGWTQELADTVGVPRVVFSPSGALSFSVFHHMWHDLPTNVDDEECLNYTVSFDKVPNCPKYPWYQLSYLYRSLKQGDPDWEFCRMNYLVCGDTWGFVFNSVNDLERVYFDYLKELTGHHKVWAVGPVLPPDDDSMISNRGGLSSMPRHDLMTWLDKRGSRSVVYVCFGSRAVLTRKQIDELAEGLDKSGVHFIWSVAQKNLMIPESNELANILAESVGRNRFEASKVENLREETLRAVGKGGSSYNALDEFVKRLNQLKQV
ncbi:hypothetical protein ACFE04_006465 [Oxalis oulophora]